MSRQLHVLAALVAVAYFVPVGSYLIPRTSGMRLIGVWLLLLGGLLVVAGNLMAAWRKT